MGYNSNIALIYLFFLYLTEQIKYQFMKRRKRRMVLIITGGFGNQLFQLAFLEHVSRTNSAIKFLENTNPVSTHSNQNYFDTILNPKPKLTSSSDISNGNRN